MGDFAGGMLKYLAKHPVARVTIAGGIGKLTKLAQGALDLHSGRSQVDVGFLQRLVPEAGIAWDDIDTAAQALLTCQAQAIPLGDRVALGAQIVAQGVAGPDCRVDVLVFNRKGNLVGRAD